MNTKGELCCYNKEIQTSIPIVTKENEVFAVDPDLVSRYCKGSVYLKV